MNGNSRKALVALLALILFISLASAIDLNSTTDFRYFPDSNMEFSVDTEGNTDIFGQLNIVDSGSQVADFSENQISLYQPLSIQSSGPLSVQNGIDLTGTSTNTINSYSSLYLETSSGSASDIVFNPSGLTDVNSDLTVRGTLDLNGNPISNADWSNADDLNSAGGISDFSNANDLNSGGTINDFSAASDLTSAGDISSFDNANDLNSGGTVVDFSNANDLNSGGGISDFSNANDLNSGGGVVACDADGRCETTQLYLSNSESADNGEIIRDNSVGFIGNWNNNGNAVLWDSYNVNGGNAIGISGGTGAESQPTIAVNEGGISHDNIAGVSYNDHHGLGDDLTWDGSNNPRLTSGTIDVDRIDFGEGEILSTQGSHSGVEMDFEGTDNTLDFRDYQNDGEVWLQVQNNGPVKTPDTNLNLGNNNINNIGGLQSCGANEFVNGNGNCETDTDTDTDNQGLPDVLSQDNTANENDIQDVASLYINNLYDADGGGQIEAQDHIELNDHDLRDVNQIYANGIRDEEDGWVDVHDNLDVNGEIYTDNGPVDVNGGDIRRASDVETNRIYDDDDGTLVVSDRVDFQGHELADIGGLEDNAGNNCGDNQFLDGNGNCQDAGAAKTLASFTSTDTSTNINQQSWTVVPWNVQVDVDSGYTHDPAGSPGQIQFDEAGTYRVSTMLSYNTNNYRINPGIKYSINGNRRNRVGLSGYSRDATGHHEASNYLTEQITVNAGDTLRVETYRYANSGTVTLRNRESNLLIEKLSETVPKSDDVDKVDGKDAADLVNKAGDTMSGDLNLGGTNNLDGVSGIYNDDTTSNFFGGCSSGQYVESINADGTVNCASDGTGTDNQNLGEVLNQGNSANQNINLNDNSITNIQSITSDGSRSQPNMVLHSTSNNDNWNDQGAYISIGESGSLGGASMHMTYRGDGKGYIGSGSVTNAVPGASYLRFDYNSNQIYSPDNLEVGTIDTGNGNYEIGQNLRTSDSVQFSSVDSTSICPDGTCDVNNYETFTSSGIGTSNIYSGSGGEIDIQSQINFNSVNMKNIQWEDANDLDSNGNIKSDTIGNSELNNGDQFRFSDTSSGPMVELQGGNNGYNGLDISMDDDNSNNDYGLRVRFEDGSIGSRDTGGDVAFTVQPNENSPLVGIDTNSPDHTLDVNGDAQITGNLQVGGFDGCSGNQFINGNGNCETDTDTDTTLSETDVEQFVFDGDNDEGGMNIGGNLDMNNNQLDSVNQLNFNGGAYIDEGAAEYGSIRLDGGESGSWGGINVQGNRDVVVGMTDADGSGFSTGAYDDSNNNWIWHYDGSSTSLRYNGGTKLETESYGVSVNTDGTNNNDGYRLDGNAALTTSGSWLRLNTDSNWNDRIYTPSVFRADGEIRTRGGMQVQGSDRHSYNGISSSTSNNGHLMLDSNGGNLYLNWDEPNGDIRMQGNKVRVDSFLDMNGNMVDNVGTANVDYVSSVGSAQDIRFNDGNDIVFRNANNNDVARVDHDERALKVNDNAGFQLPTGPDAY